MKNIILISIDNLRYDCIGYQPYKEELKKYDVLKYLETPTLDRIASESVCFTQCISTNTYTTAAHASVLTGLYPPRHGVRSFYETKLSGDVFTLAEVLKVHGYETVMMTDTKNLFVPLEMHRGFDHFYLCDDKGILAFLNKNRNKKLFIFIHFFDIHEPFLLSKHPDYVNPEYIEGVKSLYGHFKIPMGTYNQSFAGCRQLWIRLLNNIKYKDHHSFFPLYVRGVTSFDKGRFNSFIEGLDDAGILDGSVLTIFSDHGEGKSSFFDPEAFAHGGALYDSVLRVPLLIRCRDLKHRIIDKAVSLIDIFPTILKLSLPAGEDLSSFFPYRLDGLDLSSGNISDDRSIYSETWIRDNRKLQIPHVFISSFLGQRSLRTPSVKYVINGMPELFSDAEGIEKMTDEEFVQNCFRGLLWRYEDYEEYINTLHRLKKGKITRVALVEKIRKYAEYRLKPSCLKYDVIKDPFEENPVRLNERNVSMLHALQNIMAISQNSVKTRDIFDDRQVMERIAENIPPDLQVRMREIINNKHILSCIIDNFIDDNKVPIFEKNKIESFILESEDFRQYLKEVLVSSRLRLSTSILSRFRNASWIGYKAAKHMLARILPLARTK